MVMAFGGDVDTLALIFDKLQYIFRGYDAYVQGYDEARNSYKNGMCDPREYYFKVNDAVLKYSALEFLNLKALFEIKKSLDRMQNPSSARNSIPGLVSSGVDTSPVAAPGNSIASFISVKNLPGRDGTVNTNPENKCIVCGNVVQKKSKFCTSCGNKL